MSNIIIQSYIHKYILSYIYILYVLSYIHHIYIYISHIYIYISSYIYIYHHIYIYIIIYIYISSYIYIYIYILYVLSYIYTLCWSQIIPLPFCASGISFRPDSRRLEAGKKFSAVVWRESTWEDPKKPGEIVEIRWVFWGYPLVKWDLMGFNGV